MLCFMGHALMENRSGLIVQGDLTRADGHAERRAALDMIHLHSPGSTRRLTLGADKKFDSADFVADLRTACVTPHVARMGERSEPIVVALYRVRAVAIQAWAGTSRPR
jgi:hypothetical protein